MSGSSTQAAENFSYVVGAFAMLGTVRSICRFVHRIFVVPRLPKARIQELEDVLVDIRTALQEAEEQATLSDPRFVAATLEKLAALDVKFTSLKTRALETNTFYEDLVEVWRGLSKEISTLHAEAKSKRADISVATRRLRVLETQETDSVSDRSTLVEDEATLAPVKKFEPVGLPHPPPPPHASMFTPRPRPTHARRHSLPEATNRPATTEFIPPQSRTDSPQYEAILVEDLPPLEIGVAPLVDSDIRDAEEPVEVVPPDSPTAHTEIKPARRFLAQLPFHNLNLWQLDEIYVDSSDKDEEEP